MSEVNAEQREFLERFTKSERVDFAWSPYAVCPDEAKMAYSLEAKGLLSQVSFRADDVLVTASWSATPSGLIQARKETR